MNYVLHLFVLMGIYIILAMSYNLLIGYTGLFSFSHGAFFGVGAYVAGISMVTLKVGFFPALVIAVIVSAAIGVVIGLPAIRISGDYLVVASFGLQTIMITIIANWTSLTGGTLGLKGIPKPNIFGIEINSLISYFFLTLVLVMICYWFLKRAIDSPFGKILQAIREDEVAVQAMGKNVVSYKMIAFAISAGLAAFSGALYAAYITYLNPFAFDLTQTILILTMVILGGMGTFRGPIVGAIALVLLPEILRFIDLPPSLLGPIRQLIYGLAIVLFMRFRPGGIFGKVSLR